MAIKPVYWEYNHQTGRPLWVLNRADFDKVREGYGCPNCLEDFGGVLLLECPVCKHMRDADADFVPIPDYMVPEPDPEYAE